VPAVKLIRVSEAAFRGSAVSATIVEIEDGLAAAQIEAFPGIDGCNGIVVFMLLLAGGSSGLSSFSQPRLAEATDEGTADPHI
jgi:hypothetical protein